MLLAIDTSAGTSVAVVDGERGVLAEAAVADTRRHAEAIGPLISEALRAAEVDVAALGAIVAGVGPGPFTGLRVGIAAARAFAIGADRPLLSVVSHDAIAFGAYRAGHSGPLLIVTDARRRELYWSQYAGVDATGLPLRIEGPGLAKPDEVPHADTERLDAASVSAADLGLLAERIWKHNRPFAANEALYLRSPDVTPSTGRKRVTG